MSLVSSILRGALGFALVSVAAFAVWVFGGAWFEHHGGELAMYAGCCTVFVVLAGLLLHPLLKAGPGRLKRFYAIFIPAFLVYAVAWCGGWFAMGAGRGEWAGSLAGSVAFVVVVEGMLKNWRALPLAALVMFAGHSAGYFAGEKICYASLHSAGSELAWGLLYGLGFGAGIGYAFWATQRR